ncbi:hypothetical protein [Polymorphobacter sp.]|uniref:hypothetical protein n=1 Tax=Polymorphobacter sp. TaxID=1909290 RepID=UPI003F712FB8
MLLDLYAAARADPTRFLAYPRNADDFNHGRYGNRLITLTAVRTVTAFLSAASLTEGAAGFFDRTPNDFGGPGERGRRTRVRATPALITLLEDAGLSIDAIGQKGTTETIRLKAAAMARRQTKQLIEYADTPETNSLRKSLASINALLTATQIELDGEAPSGPPEAPEEPDAEPLP